MSRVLIFGGTGSLGRKLIERYLPLHDVAVYSRDESKHWTLVNEYTANKLSPRRDHLQFFVGDVRDPARVREAIRQYRPNIVIIAAALKQVDTCELSPGESVLTNLQGTQNVVNAVNSLAEQRVDPNKVLFVSTDKACAPVNVYGMCKAISERIITSQARTGFKHVKYLAVRYGNVLESRGSIVPLFKYQSLHGEFLTVTDPNMTRFLMTLDDSVNLIERALEEGNSGEIWIPRLPSMRIGDLAQIFSDRYNKSIRTIGLRPGEKNDEDLINESESVRIQRLTDDEKYYILGPAFEAGKHSSFVYSSDDNVMNRQQLEKYLSGLGIIDARLEQFRGLEIEDIATNRKS